MVPFHGVGRFYLRDKIINYLQKKSQKLLSIEKPPCFISKAGVLHDKATDLLNILCIDRKYKVYDGIA